LFRAGEAAQDLDFNPGWQNVLRLVEEEIAAIDRQLDGPNPLEHVQYAHLHGQKRGLKAMVDAHHALVHRYVAELEEQKRKHEGAGETAPGR
jgi:hypothetical protein